MILFCSTPEKYSESVLGESLMRLKINDELNVFIDNYEYELMEIVVNRKR